MVIGFAAGYVCNERQRAWLLTKYYAEKVETTDEETPNAYHEENRTNLQGIPTVDKGTGRVNGAAGHMSIDHGLNDARLSLTSWL